jgi:hypothetical protein
MSIDAPTKRTNADRQRDYRERKKAGRRVVALEVDADEMVEAGALPGWCAEDEKAIQAAAQNILRAALQKTRV